MEKILRGKRTGTVICVLAALSTVAAFFVDVSIGTVSLAINGYGVPQFLMVPLMAWLYYCFYIRKNTPGRTLITDRRYRYGIALLSLLFAVIMAIGKSFQAAEELKMFPIAFLLIPGYWFALFAGISIVTEKIVELRVAEEAPARFTEFLFEKHPVLMPMAVVLICQIPYMAAFFPCTIAWDTSYQIGQWFGIFPFTDFHPPLVTMFYGFFAWLGMQIGNPEPVMFIVVLLQSLLTAFSFAMVMDLFRRLRAPYVMRWAVLLFYALFTLWPSYSMTLLKDSIYYPFTLLYLVFVIRAIVDPKGFSEKKSNYIALFVVVLLMCLIRNNGTFVFLLSFPLLCLLFPRKGKICGVCLIAAVFAVLTLFGKAVWPAMGIEARDGGTQTMNFMAQQTVYYAKEHADEVTEEEYRVLNQIFYYDDLAEAFNPYLYDGIDDYIRVDENGESLLKLHKEEYRKAWFSQFKKHPASFLVSFLNTSFGYYYPELREYKEGLGWFQMEEVCDPKVFHVEFSEATAPLRFLLSKDYKIREMPFIGLLYGCGIYAWIGLWVVTALTAARRYRALIPAIPAVVNVLVCMVSPVNTCVRYALPTMAAIPVLIVWLWYCVGRGREVPKCF